MKHIKENKNSLNINSHSIWTGIGLFLAGISSAHAAGFALMEQSGTGLGNAFAGMTASSEDASNQFYNPASLSFLNPGRQLSVGGTLGNFNAEFNDNGSSAAGNNGGNAGGVLFIPNFYLASDSYGKLRFGLGVTSPFGLKMDYDNQWKGRYNNIESKFKAIDVNPAFSYQATEQLSVGAGLSIQYAQLKAKRGIDAAALGLGAPGNAANDSYIDLKGDDVSYGLNIGAIYKPTDAWTLGLSYRSRVKHDIKGDADFDLSQPVAGAVAGTPFLRNTNFDTRVELPEQANFGVRYGGNKDWELLGDITWTGWSSFNTLDIDFDNPNQPSTSERHNWDNSWRISLGANHRLNDKWKLRTGMYYDWSPINDDVTRTPGIPDSDRLALAFGISHEYDANTRVELAYSHIFLKDAKIDRVNTTGNTLRGELEMSADMVGLQIVRKF